MKKVIYLTVLCCSMFTASFGQTFDLSSTAFEVGDKYMPEPKIWFYYARDEIQDSSYIILDKIAAFLIENKSVVVEVGQHTDWVNPKYSIRYTDKRAKSIVTYLIGKGISKERLIPKGYGDSKMLIPKVKIDQLTNEEEKQKARMVNRRTEFVILSTNYNGK